VPDRSPQTPSGERLSWTNNQAKFNHNSSSLQGLPPGAPAFCAQSNTTIGGGPSNEDRHHRRQRPHRNEARHALADLAVGSPLNATIEVPGPEACPLDKLASKLLAASGDRRKVIADVHARYFGAELNDRSLTPGNHPRLGATRFEDWLSRTLGGQNA
jgi:hypothetical protein